MVRDCRLLDDDRQDVLLAEDEQLVVLQLELGTRVPGEEDGVADLDLHGDLLALVADAAGADGDDLAALRLLLAGVGQDDAAPGRLLARRRADDDAVPKGTELRGGCGLGHWCSPLLLAGRDALARGGRRDVRAGRSAAPPIWSGPRPAPCRWPRRRRCRGRGSRRPGRAGG